MDSNYIPPLKDVSCGLLQVPQKIFFDFLGHYDEVQALRFNGVGGLFSILSLGVVFHVLPFSQRSESSVAIEI